MNILLLGAGTQGLAMAHGAHDMGHHVSMLCTEHNNYGDRSRAVTRLHYFVPTDEEDYIREVARIVSEDEITVIIPMGDQTAQWLCKHKAALQSLAHFKIPDYDNFISGYDKNQLMKLCADKGYPHPRTLDMSDLSLDDIRLTTFPYPALLKPNMTTGGRGMVRVNNFDEIRAKYPLLQQQFGDYHLQQFIPTGGRQVKVQLFVNEDHTIREATMLEKRRWYPVNGGSNSCAVTVRDEQTIALCYQILKDLNWVGFADFDMIEHPDTHELLVMEINPRVPACIKSPMVGGVNWAQVIIEGSLDAEPSRFECNEGIVLRHLGFDILWFLKSPDRWHSRPSWFKFIGSNVHYQDMGGWSDPLPFICGTWNNVKKILFGHSK